ncbi:cupin domain-containing protein [Fusobacterium massiliense]|uniref:cupin domain-containing protein n=1 Tax=Fusobacterium massiliense TaxID=1852365 RepID=UPI00093B31D1|nr:cupin domain-containing protein [Fusobacterium massiliense]
MVKIEVAKPFSLNNFIEAKTAEVVSTRVINYSNSYVSFFALDKFEEISAEAMLGNRYYFCFNGSGEFDIQNQKVIIKENEFLEIPANNNYSVRSLDKFKIIEIGEKIGVNMENKTLNMFDAASAFNLKDIVEYQKDKIVSKNLVAKQNLIMSVMAFWKGESLDPHKAPGDALVTVLDGKGKYIVDGKEFVLNTGESAVLPANIPHAVEGIENFKMLLILVKD